MRTRPSLSYYRILSNFYLSLAPSMESVQPYLYTPLHSPKSIRVLVLHKGQPGNCISVSLQEETFSHLLEYEALSYEWGKSNDRHQILCDGKSLMVAPNLFTALKRLRLPGDSRRLWIDAICINQEDSKEKLHQISFMTNIYSTAGVTLMWLGEEGPYTGEAMSALASIAHTFPIPEDENNTMPRMGSIKMDSLPAGSDLQVHTTKAYWDGIVDLVSSRSYFTRLWVVQEIVLSRSAKVVCGKYSMEWTSFYKAARSIYLCHFFDHKIDMYSILTHINQIGLAKRNRLQQIPTLWALVSGLTNTEVTKREDRIWGLLGLLEENVRDWLLDVPDHELPFEKATAHMILTDQHLAILDFLNWAPEIRAHPQIPSWVPSLGDHSFSFCFPALDARSDIIWNQPGTISITDSVLTVHGYIIDHVERAWKNFSEENMEKIVFQLCDVDLQASEAYNTAYLASTALWQTLMAFKTTEDSFADYQQSFYSCLSAWQLKRLGLTDEVLDRNPRLSTLGQEHQLIKSKYAARVSLDLTVAELCEGDQTLDWTLKNHAIGGGEAFEKRMQTNLYNSAAPVGRNLFTSTKGFFGVGPVGSAKVESLKYKKAVRPGDCIAIISKAISPIILRPEGGGKYIIVGTAYIGSLLNDQQFKPENLPKFGPISIL